MTRPVTLATALIRIPRHRFVPRAAWASPRAGGTGWWIDRDRDPDAWWEAVSSDTVIVTQIHDGTVELTEETAPQATAYSSSASAPSLVVRFLEVLGVTPGDRVLEIGTGTGYTAGLLAALTGDPGLVTTVEVDPAVAATAACNLGAAGAPPRLVVGDGAAGAPDAAPFDRVHVTCGVQEVPHTWLTQTRPGGVIVLPWTPAARMLRLTVSADGTAHGTFHDTCAFMALRAQRSHGPGEIADNAWERPVSWDPSPVLAEPPGLQLHLAGTVGTRPTVVSRSTGPLAILSSGTSHALLRNDGTGPRVVQRGPRALWDETERACRDWLALGSPGPERIGLSITPTGHRMWLDRPDQVIPARTGDEERE